MKKRWPYCQWFWARRTDFVQWMHNDAHIQTLCTRIVYRRDWCTLVWRFYEILAWRFVSKIKHCRVNMTERLVTSVPHRISQQAVLVCVCVWEDEIEKGLAKALDTEPSSSVLGTFTGVPCHPTPPNSCSISVPKNMFQVLYCLSSTTFLSGKFNVDLGYIFSRILTRLPSPATLAKRCCLHVGRDVLQGFCARAACHCTEHLCVSWLFIGGLLHQEYTNASVKQSLELLCMSFCDALLWEWIVVWGVKLQRYISCDICWNVSIAHVFALQHVLKGKSKMDLFGLHVGKAVRLPLNHPEVCIVALRDRCRFVL